MSIYNKIKTRNYFCNSLPAGVPHLLSGVDVMRERTRLPVVPCRQYELKLLAEMKDKTSIESSSVLVMTRGQPEFTADVLSQIELRRARTGAGAEVTVGGLWSDLSTTATAGFTAAAPM